MTKSFKIPISLRILLLIFQVYLDILSIFEFSRLKDLNIVINWVFLLCLEGKEVLLRYTLQVAPFDL